MSHLSGCDILSGNFCILGCKIMNFGDFIICTTTNESMHQNFGTNRPLVKSV